MMTILNELERAKAKFPTWPTDPIHAMAVVNEEVGELNKAVLQQVYEPHKNKDGLDEIRKEAVQVAAMMHRFLESLDAYRFEPSAQHTQHVPCAACDRGDYQLGHSDFCPNNGVTGVTTAGRNVP